MTDSETQGKCPTNLYIQAAGHHHNSSITNSLSLTPHYFTRRTAHCQKPGGSIYGKSITDPCLGWEKTERLILDIAELR